MAIPGYVDIHVHLLPAIDDGPPDLDQAVAMARAAVESGITTMAVTPHLNPEFPKVNPIQLAGRCGHLRSVLEEEGIPLTLRSGGEVAVAWGIEAGDEQLALASYAQRGTDLLVETPFSTLVGFTPLLSELQAKGYRITVAHPERNSDYQRDPSRVRELVDAGMLVQINAESLLGRGPARRAAESLLTAGLAHVIASDGHRAASWRPVTRLGEAVEAAAELVGRERALWMAEAAPRAIIDGAALPSAPAIIERPRLGRLFGLTRARPRAGR